MAAAILGELTDWLPHIGASVCSAVFAMAAHCSAMGKLRPQRGLADSRYANVQPRIVAMASNPRRSRMGRLVSRAST